MGDGAGTWIQPALKLMPSRRSHVRGQLVVPYHHSWATADNQSPVGATQLPTPPVAGGAERKWGGEKTTSSGSRRVDGSLQRQAGH